MVGLNVAPPYSAATFQPPLPVNTSFVYSPAGSPLPFPDRSFDVVLSMNVLEHVADLQLFLGEAARVVKVSVPCFSPMCNFPNVYFPHRAFLPTSSPP